MYHLPPHNSFHKAGSEYCLKCKEATQGSCCHAKENRGFNHQLVAAGEAMCTGLWHAAQACRWRCGSCTDRDTCISHKLGFGCTYILLPHFLGTSSCHSPSGSPVVFLAAHSLTGLEEISLRGAGCFASPDLWRPTRGLTGALGPEDPPEWPLGVFAGSSVSPQTGGYFLITPTCWSLIALAGMMAHVSTLKEKDERCDSL